MNTVTIPLRSMSGAHLETTLQFLRAEVRRRHVWGGFSIQGGGGASRFEGGYGIGIVYHGKRARVEIRFLISSSQNDVPIEITDYAGTLSEVELRDFGQSVLLATLDAARADKRVDQWVRRSALYFG